MSPSNGTLLPTCESTSHLQKNTAKKRSLLTSRAECDASNDDINYKRIKFDVHSQEDINEAVQTTSNGYMTRNRLKHELKKKNVTELNIIKKKSSKNEESTKNLEKAKRIKKTAKETLKNKLQFGYVFTSDIFIQYPELQQATQLKKNTPSLFESDSEQESEIDCIQINNHTDEVESKSISNLKSEFIFPTLHKNPGVKTYFNKKSCSSNNKLNVTSPTIVKTSPKIKNSSNLSDHINLNEKINETSEISSFNNTMNSIKIKNNDEDTTIIAGDTISHLEQELRMENINSSQEKSKDNEVKSHNSESLSLDFTNNIVDDECSIKSSLSNSVLEQKVDLNELIDTEPYGFETTQVTENNFSSIFDIPKTKNTLVKNEVNLNLKYINENCISSQPSKTTKNTLGVYDSINDFENENSVDQNNICMINTFVDECSSSSSLLEQKVNFNELIDSESLAFETTRVNENNFSSIFDIPKTQNIPVKKEENLNLNFINENCIFSPSFNTSKKTVEVYDSLTNDFVNGASDQSIENHLIQGNNHFNELKNTDFSSQIKERQTLELSNFVTHKFFNSINYNDRKRKSETLFSETENDNSSFVVDNSSKKSKNEQSDLKCHCKIFYTFNINANKKLTSKPNHFVFNTNAKKLHQKVLHQKYLEANILDMLIRKDSKNIKSEKLTPTSNTVFTNINYEKKVHIIENDHIKPTILSMLKDVHVDLEYISEYCEYNKDDTLVGLQTIDKNVHISKSINKITTINESMDTFIPHDKNYIKFGEKKSYMNSCITKKNESTNFKPYDHITVGFSKNKNRYNDIVSNTTSVDISPVHLKPCEKINIDSDEQKKTKTLNFTKTNKSDNFIFNKENNENVSKNVHSNNDNVSNTILIDIPPVHLKPYEKINIDSDEQKKTKTLNFTKTNKSDNIIFNKENNENVSKNVHSNNNNVSNTTSVDIPLVHLKPCEKINIDSDEQKKSNNDNVSNITIVNIPPVHIEPYEEINIDFDEQKKTKTLNIPKTNKSDHFKSCKDNNKKFTKNVHSNNGIVSNIKTAEIPSVLVEPYEEINLNVSFVKNQIVPSSIESNIQGNVFDLPKPPVYGNCFDYMPSPIKDKNMHIFSVLPHESEQPNNSLFNLSNHDIENSLGNSSSDDDTRLKIEDDEADVNHKIPKNPKFVCSMDSLKDLTVDDEQINNVKDSIVNDNLSSECITDVEFCEIKSIESKKEHVKIRKVNDKVLKPIVLNEEISNNKYKNLHILKEENNSLTNCMVMTIEECNDFIANKSLNNRTTYKNTFFSKKINYIFKEMYVDDIFVSLCQHMVETCEFEMFFQTVNNHKLQSVNRPIEREVNDIKTKNDDTNIYSTFGKSIPPTNAEIIINTEVDNSYQKNNETSSSNIKKINSNSPQKAKSDKSNIKIRIIFRNLINSDKMLNDILESKDFRNLRFFKEEEIACSIGVLIFEAMFDPPIITGLSAYQVNYDQLGNEEKSKELESANLSIICPKIMKLTTITLALVKMLRSNTLIDLILNAIRKNLLNKKMNTNHTVDNQLMKQTVYFIDICVRLRLLKTLQTFIFDSMVLLPNKYCCIIFISLLLWKNCLPRRVNNEIDPVLITVISYLIAKKKFYSEQIVGRDIFQRELINLLSFRFNYSFVTDLPYNFIQHVHKPDFSISVIIFLKCCNPKDSSEFIVNCLFPIIEDYLDSQENENNAIQVMESIYMATKPFRITCNSTVAIYLNKCKSAISGIKKDQKEHIYNTTYNSYRILQNKFVEYLNDPRPRSQLFEESLISIIMVLGSVDYVTSCVPLMKWNPKFPLSTILCKKMNMFKSIIGHPLWDKLCVMNDTNVIKCLVNSCVLKKDVYNTILRIHCLH